MRNNTLLCLLATVSLSCSVKTLASNKPDEVISITIDSLQINLTLKADIGQVDADYQRQLAQFVAEEMFLEDDEQTKMPAYQGDMKAFLQTCAKMKWEELKEQTYQFSLYEGDSEVPTEEEIKAYVAASMAKYKVPSYVSFVKEFPMNGAGKILKYKLRERAIEEKDLKDAAAIETA